MSEPLPHQPATPHLMDLRMQDGSRHFLSLPQSSDWYTVRDHVSLLQGAELTGFICDHVTEAWIDFRFMEHDFSINDQAGEYWFFVRDPRCDDGVLNRVAQHFAALHGGRGQR